MRNITLGKILSKITKGMVVAIALTAIVFVHGASAKTDEERANFRNVQAGSMGKNVLYRSAHPARPTDSGSTARAKAANKLMQAHGIQTVLNFADTDSDLKRNFKKVGATPSTYYYMGLYEKGKVRPSYMKGPGKSTRNSSYRKKIATAMKFFTTNEGPYLIHCVIGRDRTGITIEILLGLMGAPYDYMLEDWAKTDQNLYGSSKSSAMRKARDRLDDDLEFITGKNLHDDEWGKVSFAPYVEEFLKKGGMSSSEVEKLKSNLSKSYTDDGKPTNGSNEGGGGNSGNGNGGDNNDKDSNKDGNKESNDPGPEPDITIKPEREAKCTSILNSSLCDEGNGEDSIIYILKFIANTITVGIVVLGTIGIIYSGFIIITASSDEGKIKKAKTRILEIVVGFILWALFYMILGLFLPDTPNIEEASSGKSSSLVAKK